MDKASALRQYFGHSSFRPGQERLVDGILSGRDALGIMPTGGGKSLCYQVPALLLPGLTLVVSPLISLMKDQVAALTAAGVPAAFFNSSQTLEEYQEVFRGIRSRAYRLVYVAPERLENPRFAQLMAQQDVSLLAVDEAHCISQWGQDFRPSYLKIADFSANLCRRPIMAAFTATATARVQEDIVTQLALQRPVRVVTGFDRPNLFFDVQRPRHKLSALLSLIAQRPGKSGIVYCATRSAVERVWTALNEHGIPAARYHAGLPEEERRANQDDFQFDRRAVMVATNAFGMGIDKSNVSFVIHYNMPKNLEAYYQEAGRAGRDGEAADCILLYSPGDVTTARYLIDHSADGSELTQEAHHALRRMEQDRLAVMTDYCKTDRCLRELRQLPGHFFFFLYHRPRPDDFVLRKAGAGQAGLPCGSQPCQPGAAGQQKPAGAGAGAGPAAHLWPDAGHQSRTAAGLSGLPQQSGSGVHRPGARHPAPGSGSWRRAVPRRTGHHDRQGAPGPGEARQKRPGARCRPRRPGGQRAALGPQGGARPTGSAGRRSGVHRLFQRHPGRHGGKGPRQPGSAFAGVRRGRGEGRPLRRRIPGRHRRPMLTKQNRPPRTRDGRFDRYALMISKYFS